MRVDFNLSAGNYLLIEFLVPVLDLDFGDLDLSLDLGLSSTQKQNRKWKAVRYVAWLDRLVIYSFIHSYIYVPGIGLVFNFLILKAIHIYPG